MQFIVRKEIAVEAETPEEAVANSDNGKTISIAAMARPQPPPVQTPHTTPAPAAK